MRTFDCTAVYLYTTQCVPYLLQPFSSFRFFFSFRSTEKQNKNASHLLLQHKTTPHTVSVLFPPSCTFVCKKCSSFRESQIHSVIIAPFFFFFSTSKLNEAGVSLSRHTFFEYRSHTFSMTHHHISCFVREKKEWCCSFISLSFPMDDTPQVFLLSLTQWRHHKFGK